MTELLGRQPSFLILDPLHGQMQAINNPDYDLLKKAVEARMILMAEFPDGSREYVTPEDIMNFYEMRSAEIVHLVDQEYYVPLMESLIDLVKEIAASIPAPMSADNELHKKLSRVEELANEMYDYYKPNLENEE